MRQSEVSQGEVIRVTLRVQWHVVGLWVTGKKW